MEVKIKYFSEDYPRLKKITQGDWIDLRVDRIKKIITRGYGEINTDYYCSISKFKSFYLEKGQVIKFRLGVAMELPEGFEAEIRPRSSTFTNYGLIQTNSVGTIDNSYCGDDDEWMIEFIAMRNGIINRFDRVCQFRIVENQPDFTFKEVDKLRNDNRGGYGSTGRD